MKLGLHKTQLNSYLISSSSFFAIFSVNVHIIIGFQYYPKDGDTKKGNEGKFKSY